MQFIHHQCGGRDRLKSKSDLRSAILLLLVLVLPNHAGLLLAQETRSILASSSAQSTPPMIESIQPLLPAAQPVMPPSVVPPPAADPYAIADEVGPYDPGMGWI